MAFVKDWVSICRHFRPVRMRITQEVIEEGVNMHRVHPPLVRISGYS